MARTMNVTGPTLSGPRWAGDYGNREHLVPGGAKLDASAFNATDAVVVTVGAAGALAAATSVPVDALSGPIPSGTVLNFGTNKFARLTADAAAGATSLTTAAIPTALVDNDTATYAGVGTKAVPSGTVVGRTFTEQANEDPFGPAADSDDEIYLTFHDVTDLTVNDDVTLYRHGGVVKVNFLPVWSALSSALKAAIRAAYTTTTGAP
jgi:hypothetical protein